MFKDNTADDNRLVNRKEIYTLRAHHGMCLAYFQGKGYSGSFTEHMGRVRDHLEMFPDQEIRVGACADVICSACPNLHGDVCESAEKTMRYDREVLRRCGLPEGEKITWKDFSARIQENILRAGKRTEICGDCQWNDLCRDDFKNQTK